MRRPTGLLRTPTGLADGFGVGSRRRAVLARFTPNGWVPRSRLGTGTRLIHPITLGERFGCPLPGCKGFETRQGQRSGKGSARPEGASGRANLADFARLGNATLHVFSRVSHGVPTEVPEELANVIADFVEHGVVTAATLQRGLREMAAAR